MTPPHFSRLALGLILIPTAILPFGIPLPTPRSVHSTWCPTPEMRRGPVETADLDDLTLTLPSQEAEPMLEEATETVDAAELPDERARELVAIGARIKTLRNQLGVDQVVLARRLGMHQSVVSRMEAGCHAMSCLSLARICRVLGVTPNEILGFDGDLPRPPVAEAVTDLED